MGRTVPPSPEHAALIAAAQRGDRGAFEQLVVAHAAALHRVIRRLVRDDHDAREATQETFLRAWRGLAGFRGDAAFSTWLYRIGVNEANRVAAARARTDQAASLDATPIDPPDPAPGPQRSAEQRALRAALDRAIASLHPDYRAPLVLRDIEGLSTREAAAILGLREAAFKSRLHRARMHVREAVADHL